MKFTPAGVWNKWNGIIAALVVAIIAALVLGPSGELTVYDADDSKKNPDAAVLRPAPSQADMRNALDLELARKKGRSLRRLPEEDPAISEHLDKLGTELEPDEAAARLSALGNLYRQKKGDLHTAASYYELLLERYPEWQGAPGVYRELMACYESTGDQQALRLLYRKILDSFPEDSDIYRVAHEALEKP